ncbi:hypothetical protein [Baekduia soli]|uniref:hypothetical protein n=1 Tax=Baekduia soli TaxID=496014 RepID=UPI001E3C45A1|nr:hypothetical protein [Baekduia soli]
MRARTRYELKVVRATIEVVDVAQGEGVLFWDCTPRQRRRMAEALIRDLDRLSPEDFLYQWAVAEPEHFD